MCVAYPGRVVSIEGTHGMVDFSGSEVRVNLSMVPAKLGDYVLVHAGIFETEPHPGLGQHFTAGGAARGQNQAFAHHEAPN